MTYNDTWNLDSIFSGGPNSDELHNKMDELKNQIEEFETLVDSWQPSEGNPEADTLLSIIELVEVIEKGLGQTRTFSNGHLSADVTDDYSVNNLNKISMLISEHNNIYTRVQKKLESINDSDWKALLEKEPFDVIAFRLIEERSKAAELLSTDEERIISKLSLDGHHGWSDLYNDLVATIQVPVEEDGQINYYSAGQAHNKIAGEVDPTKRQEILKAWENAWQEKAPLFATTLNRIIGFRLANYDLHDEDDYLKPALKYNRLTEETLNSMWRTIEKNKGKIIEFMERKAELMGVDQLGWADVDAPISVGDFNAKTYSYTEAAEFIMENFEKVSPEMKKLSQTAFEDRWIEAADRPNKRPGGYCASVPEHNESRIFMTYSGTADNVSTLAHELGHAFHSHVLVGQPKLNTEYAMNVAETASTFAELVVSDATIKNADSTEEKISLLDGKISRAAIMFMDIHSRFLFEKNFYAERKKGLVSSDRMNEIMLDAQKEAFVDSLSTYHPTFWASKLHFFMTGLSFYNFPYTFGFLFSLGIYARSMDSGDEFEGDYIRLLQDTASMSTEDLAQKHLDVDLTRPDFWQSAIDLVNDDIDTYLDMTEEYR